MKRILTTYLMVTATVMALGAHNINAHATGDLVSLKDLKEPMQVTREIEVVQEKSDVQEITEVKEVENEKEYRYIDCPLSKELQQGIFDICESYNISFEFIMAIIEQESSFNIRALGDNCESKGLMQIQKKWHYELMDELGVTDLYVPLDNVKVGVALLSSYFEEDDDVYYVLMKYNGGARYANNMMKSGKVSSYAREITERSARYEEENGI